MRFSISTCATLLVWMSFIPVVCAADDTSVRETLKAYAEAYNKHDAAAVGALWAENATHIDRVAGTRTDGRKAIQADLEAFFKSNTSARLSAEVDSFRAITDHVVSVEGRSVVSSGDGIGQVSNFSAILVKTGDKWMFNTVEELPAVPTTGSKLADLEWLVGKWVDESQDGKIESDFRWSNSGTFLLRSYTKHSPDGSESLGTQIIGWDPRAQQIRSWSFHSDGSFCEATWSRHESEWMVKTDSTLADGRTAAGTYVMTPVDANSMKVQLIGHSIEGEPQPAGEAIVLVKSSSETPAKASEPTTK